MKDEVNTELGKLIDDYRKSRNFSWDDFVADFILHTGEKITVYKLQNIHRNKGYNIPTIQLLNRYFDAVDQSVLGVNAWLTLRSGVTKDGGSKVVFETLWA